jgi:hypothetical protein
LAQCDLNDVLKSNRKSNRNFTEKQVISFLW